MKRNPYARAGLDYADNHEKAQVIQRGRRDTSRVPPWAWNDDQMRQVIGAYLGRYVGETKPTKTLADLQALESRVLKSYRWNSPATENTKHREFINQLGGSPAQFYVAMIYRVYRLGWQAKDVADELESLTGTRPWPYIFSALNRVARKILPAESCLPATRPKNPRGKPRSKHFNMWHVIYLRGAGLCWDEIAPIVGVSQSYLQNTLHAIKLQIPRNHAARQIPYVANKFRKQNRDK
jgi:hypothetical protein